MVKSADVKTVGSKLEVWRQTAKHTSGGLTKVDLMLNKHGKVVSKAKHDAGLKTGVRNLGAYLQTRSVHAVKGGKRITRKGGKKGEGIFGDIGSAVDSVGSFLGLGLTKRPRRAAPKRAVKRGGDAYTSSGGGIFGDIGSAVDGVGHMLGLGLAKRGGDAYVSTGGAVRGRGRRC